MIPCLPQAKLELGIFVAQTIVVTVLAAWLMFRTGGSLLIAILFHLAINDVPGLFGAGFNPMAAAYGLAAAAVVLLDREFRTGRMPQPGPVGCPRVLTLERQGEKRRYWRRGVRGVLW